MRKNPITLPKSVTSSWINISGVAALLISIHLVHAHHLDSSSGVLVCAASVAFVIVALEFLLLRVFRRPSTGLRFDRRRPVSLKRVLLRLFALYLTLGVIALFYLLIPEYHRNYYAPYWPFATHLLIIVAVGAIPYFALLDAFLVRPEDSYWYVAMALLGRSRRPQPGTIKNYVLGWVVKAFFLPLMFTPLGGDIDTLTRVPFSSILEVLKHAGPLTVNAFAVFYNYAINLIFTIDLSFAFIGYVLTLRILDSHVRTAEPTFLGWYVTVQCYDPFDGMVNGRYLAIHPGNNYWGNWLHNYPALYLTWGSVILILLGIYVWATISFGVRFSNLTNRGILTNGPYRFMRHPAYVCKNISWWLIAIPFVSHAGFLPGAENCTLLLVINLLYFLRAKTEERHLSRDPVYVEYATSLNEKGVFRKLSTWVPIFGYRVPAMQDANTLR